MIFLRRMAFVVAAFLLVALASAALLSPKAVGDFFYDVDEISAFLRLILLLVIYGAIAGVGYLRFTRPPHHQVKGLVVQSAGSVTALSIESAHDRVLKAIKDLPGVAAADVSIKAVSGKADIGLNVMIDGDGKTLPERQKVINRTLEQVVKKQLGLKMAQPPTVQISFSDAPQSLPPQQEAAPSVAATTGLEEEPAAPAEENVVGRFLGGLLGRGERHPDKADVSEGKIPPPLKDHVPVPPVTKKPEPMDEKADDEDDDFYAMLQEMNGDESDADVASDASDPAEVAAEADDKPDTIILSRQPAAEEESPDKIQESSREETPEAEPDSGGESAEAEVEENDADDQKSGKDT